MAFFILAGMNWICIDGKMVKEDEPVLRISNRGFRFGDGLFETMRLRDGRIHLELYHMDRLFSSLSVLGIDPDSLSEESLSTDIKNVATKNDCMFSARVRVSIYRNENDSAGYVIEASPFVDPPKRNWEIDIYPYARKAIDPFSNLKSSNYLPYVMAGKFAAKENLDEAIVLNAANRICDGSRTNVFLVHNGKVSTPALHQGCVNGIMRRHVIELLKNEFEAVHQFEITEEHMRSADEIFLTNALIGIQPVVKFRDRQYGTQFAQGLARRINRL